MLKQRAKTRANRSFATQVGSIGKESHTFRLSVQRKKVQPMMPLRRTNDPISVHVLEAATQIEPAAPSSSTDNCEGVRVFGSSGKSSFGPTDSASLLSAKHVGSDSARGQHRNKSPSNSSSLRCRWMGEGEGKGDENSPARLVE